MIVVLMGVSGCGKTTIGKLLAERWGCAFSDADDFHPAANIEKMRLGQPLTDDDRWPWLRCLRKEIEECISNNKSIIFACSALKNSYRKILSPTDDVIFIYLKGDKDLISRRLKERSGHYMNPALLQSQFDALEEPGTAITVDISPSPEKIVEKIVLILTE